MQLLRYGFWKNDAVLFGTQNISKEHAILHLLPLGGSNYVFLSTRMNGVTLDGGSPNIRCKESRSCNNKGDSYGFSFC